MSFKQTIIEPVLHSLDAFKERKAFYIDKHYYTYNDLSESISKIRVEIAKIPEDNVGLVANDDLETYASIFALWLEGKCYVPLHPEQPMERCMDIVRQIGMEHILDSSEKSRYAENMLVMTRELTFETYHLNCDKEYSDEKAAYILFTSGSTGKPKGVVITRKNIEGFANAFRHSGYQLNNNDRCLQMFDLTFDLSVQSYLMPLMAGACIYTVGLGKLKYEAVFELIDTQDLTFALMVPSIIHYLHPYLDEINAPSMKYSLFCGEALIEEELKDWSKCVPNARIDNVYGPTENTIYCTRYTFKPDSVNKGINGIVSIGKAMKGTETFIIDENKNILTPGERGELCLSGIQLSPGYWKNPEKNAEAFFETKGKRIYRTGDLCAIDEEGDILYFGRMDFQVKIQGYRIELGEIEHHAREFLGGIKVAAIVHKNEAGNDTLALCAEKEAENPLPLIHFLKSKIPSYMVPTSVHYVKSFPLNINGKTDRKALKSLVEKNE